MARAAPIDFLPTSTLFTAGSPFCHFLSFMGFLKKTNDCFDKIEINVCLTYLDGNFPERDCHVENILQT
jgi:hypothetical protein